MPAKPLHFLCFGAGAIGTYIGVSLAQTGHQVTFLEQPGQLDALRQHGLRLQTETGEVKITQPRLAASVDEAFAVEYPYDAALFALKSFDTQAALVELAPYKATCPPLLCLQNGVDNEPAIAAALGADKVIAATVTSAIGRRAVGEVILERRRGLGIAAGHPLSAALCDAFQEAGLNARLFPSAASMKWSKLLTNLMVNASSAILGMPPAEILSHPGLFRLEVQQMREALRVMQTQSIQVVDLPGTPVRALAFAVQHLPLNIARLMLAKSIGSGRGAKMPSFYIDLHSGRGQTEVDYLNGAIVRYGTRSGVPTPVNKTLNNILLALVRGELPIYSYLRQPDKLLDRFTSLA